jgi:hypothetical protein
MTPPIEYLPLRDALRDHPDYAQIPADDKKSCAMFLHMMKDIDEGRPVGESSLAKMYGLALSEAHRLHKKGRLAGIKVPEAPAAPANPKKNKFGAARAEPCAMEDLGASPAPAANDTTTNANDDPAPETPDATPEPTATQELTTAAANDAVQVQETPAVPTDDVLENPADLAVRHDPVEVCAAEVVDDDPASEITRLHGEIETSLHMSVDHAIRIGELLAQEKQKLGHGRFLPWVKATLPFTERTAQKYMQVYSGQANLKCESGSHLTAAYRLTAPKAKAKSSEGGRKAKPETEQQDDDATEQTTNDESATEQRDEDQGEHTQADDKATDKPTSTQAHEAGGDQRSSSASEDTASSTEAQERDTASTTEATRPSAHEQTKGTNAEANSTTNPQEKPPQATPRQALDILVAYVRKKGKGAARAINREINDEAGLSWWAQTSKPRDDLSALEDHVAHRLEALADKDLEDATAWLKEHVEQLWGIIRERVPRQEGDDRTDNSDDYE